MKKNFKVFISGVLTSSLIFFLFASGFSKPTKDIVTKIYNDLKIYVSGDLVQIKDANGKKIQPINYDGDVYLPLKSISEILGNDVIFDKEKNIINISKKNEDLEIEKKYLIKAEKIPYNLDSLDKYELTQTYISYSPEIRVRKANDDLFFLSIKVPKDNIGLVRDEQEYNISEDSYNSLFKKGEGNVIKKDRYQGEDGENYFSIDIYKGSLQGLAVLEIEFDSVDNANKFAQPNWVEKDVTNDSNYKNANLARFGLNSN